MQKFWDILDFAWGDADQYANMVLDTGSSDSLGDDPAAGSTTPEPPIIPPAHPDAESVDAVAAEPPSTDVPMEVEDDEDSLTALINEGEYVVPYVPDWMGPDAQGQPVDKTESEHDTTPAKSEAFGASSIPSETSRPVADPAISACDVDTAVAEAQSQLLLAQIRLARPGLGETTVSNQGTHSLIAGKIEMYQL